MACNDADSHKHEDNSCHPRDDLALRERLLRQHERGDQTDPKQVHHAGHEQQQHQYPATPRAEHAVAKTHVECATRAFAPPADDEVQGRAAVL